LYKEGREVEEQLEKNREKYLQDGPSANPKEYMRSLLLNQCYKSIDQLKFLPQEKEML
jgi:hypothetical protein